jgi:hypothetical protein
MKSVLKKSLHWWNEFWFGARDLRALAAMRILVGATYFYIYLIRGLFNMDYFNGNWMVSREQAFELFHPLTRPTMTWFFWPDSWAGGVHTVFVILLLLITLGLAVRPMILLAWVLHIGFVQRNYAVIYGADLILTVFLLYLAGTQCCDVWTLKSKLFKFKEKIISTDPLNSVAFRMIQVHIAVIYAYTGFEKLKGASWWDGTALWSVFSNQQIIIHDMTFMRHVPWLISIITFTTILFEIYWPAAVLTKARNPWLIIGVLFHLTIGYLMQIWAFSMVMISTYFLFLDFNKVEIWYRTLKARIVSK